MLNYQEILNQAIDNNREKPKSTLLVDALLSAEKSNHLDKKKYQFEELIGTWRLCFITGTKNTRHQFAKIIGAGFYLPSFIKITISYQFNSDKINSHENEGKVENKVEVGLVKFALNGPIKYINKKNILAFDFTYLIMSILGIKIYQTDVRGGEKSNLEFYQNSIKQQAFFSYFLITDNLIAARGRGGGLALWKKEQKF